MADKEKNLFDLDAGVPGIEGEMRPKPKYSDRISKRVLGVALLAVGIVVFIFLASLNNMGAPKPLPADKVAEAAKTRDENNGPPLDLHRVPGSKEDMPGEDQGKQAASLAGTAPANVAPASSVPGTVVPSFFSFGSQKDSTKKHDSVIPSSKDLPSGVDSHPVLTAEQQAAKQEETNRLARLEQARSGGLKSSTFSAGGDNSAATAGSGMNALKAELASLGKNAGAGGGTSAPPKTGADGEQDEKLGFLKAASTEARTYHPHIPLPAISPNEVKAGTFIHLALEQGINSDLPGEVTARVTEDVYDTISGCRLLIPAMSTAIGRYDSKVALGQDRNLIVWNSMVFKDGAELNLAGMEAYDTAGMAGMGADVDNHFLRLFGLTFGMSLLTAGTQMSVPPPPPSTNGLMQPSFQQNVATALAQQYGQLGAELLGKYMAVQPTLRNFPGERFTIMVPHTIVFQKVWRDRCEQVN